MTLSLTCLVTLITSQKKFLFQMEREDGRTREIVAHPASQLGSEELCILQDCARPPKLNVVLYGFFGGFPFLFFFGIWWTAMNINVTTDLFFFFF